MNTLDSKTIEEIKEMLLTERTNVMKSLEKVSQQDSHEADNRGTKFPEFGDKPDENAQEISEYSTSVVSEKVLEDALTDINAALQRIADEKYGVCKYCQKPIDVRRLLARPAASSCVECKRELQQND